MRRLYRASATPDRCLPAADGADVRYIQQFLRHGRQPRYDEDLPAADAWAAEGGLRPGDAGHHGQDDIETSEPMRAQDGIVSICKQKSWCAFHRIGY